MAAPHPTAVTLFIVLPLVAWRVYLRFRRMVGRQKMSPYRPWVQLILFPALLLLFAWGAHVFPVRLALLLVGVIAGVCLSVYGLRMTKFEVTPGRLYYTPHAPLGIALSLLFVGRLLYRGLEVYVLDTAATPGVQGFAQSPVTLGVFGLLAGYYIGYAIGLVRWRWGVLAKKLARNEAQQEVQQDSGS